MAESHTPRIGVVDDDLWVRAGRAAALTSAGFDVRLTCDHEEALTDHGVWTELDVVLVDAWDSERDWDRFPGVRVVEAVRRSPNGAGVLVIVISGHATNEILRLRMAEAGADFFYAHSELRTTDDLVRAISNPDAARRSEPGTDEQLAILGMRPSTRLNATLHDIEERGLEAAFQPATSQKALPVGRRTLITARRRLGDIARLAGRSDAPDRAPEWRRLVRAVNLARGVEEPSSG